MCFASGIEFSVSSGDFTSTHLLRLRLLDVADSDQREQPVEMPCLTYERYLERDHPVVDELCCDDIPALWSSRWLAEPRGSHLGIDVLVDVLDVFFRQLTPNLVGHVGSSRHDLDVVENLFDRFLGSTQERLFVFGLPF